jgi:hypothetical protein
MIDFIDDVRLTPTRERLEERRLWSRIVTDMRNRYALSVTAAVLFEDSVAKLNRYEVAEDVHALSQLADFLEREDAL